MKKTFVCDESMVITVPIGSLRDAREGHLMPEKFHCVFRDSYKVFTIRGKPKPLGAAQAIVGVFLFILGLLFTTELKIYTLPSVVFVVCGMLSYAAGQCPNIHVAKLSFSLNIISFFWAIAAFTLSLLTCLPGYYSKLHYGVTGLIMSLLVMEDLIAIILIYWLSKAVCKENFNTLPVILLKQAD